MNSSTSARTSSRDDHEFVEDLEHPRLFSPGDHTLYKAAEYLVDGLIPKGHPVMFFGDGGSLKSITTQHLGISLSSSGVDTWLGKKIPTTPVLNLEYEQSKEEHATRAIQIIRGLGIDTPPLDYLCTMECDQFNFWDIVPIALKWAQENCHERERDGVLILDSLGYALPGNLEDQGTAIRFYQDFLTPLKKFGVTPIIVHHQPKYSRVPYGSVYLVKNNFRSQWLMEDSSSGDTLSNTKTIRMEDIKRNYTSKKDDIHIMGIFSDEDTPEGDRAIWITKRSASDVETLIREKDPSDREQIIQDLMENGKSTRDRISERTGLKYSTVKARVFDLLEEGELRPAGKEGRKDLIDVPEMSNDPNPSDPSGPGHLDSRNTEEEVRSTPLNRTSGPLDLTGDELLEKYPKRRYPNLFFKTPEGKYITRVEIWMASHPWTVVDDSQEGKVIITGGKTRRG